MFGASSADWSDEDVRRWLGAAWEQSSIENVRQAGADAKAIAERTRNPVGVVLQVLGCLSSWEVPWPDPVVGWPELHLCPADFGPAVDLDAPIYGRLGHVRCLERKEWVATGDLVRHLRRFHPELAGGER